MAIESLRVVELRGPVRAQIGRVRGALEELWWSCSATCPVEVRVQALKHVEQLLAELHNRVADYQFQLDELDRPEATQATSS